MAKQPVEFYISDSGPTRTGKLNMLARCVESNTGRIRAVENALGSSPPPSSPGDPSDPGDLIVYYENGKA